MAHTSSHKSPSSPTSSTYVDVVRLLNDQTVREDLNTACAKLGQATAALMAKVDGIAKQIHTVDLLRHGASLKPRWDSIRKELGDLLWQLRTNANVVSERLKLFNTAVLPMAVQNYQERSTRPPPFHQGLQVLRSYMKISKDQAELTRALLERSVRLNSNVLAFLNDLTKLVGRHAVKGQKEMCNLSEQLAQLAHHVERLLVATRDARAADCSHILFTSARLVLSSGQSPGRSKVTRRQFMLKDDVGRAYEHIDRKRNEVAHVQYAAQMHQSPSDPLSSAHTSLCTFFFEELLITEAALNLFLSTWSRLRNDCAEIFQWSSDPNNIQSVRVIPTTISCHMETGATLYAPLITALDIYTAGLPEWVCTR